MKNKSYITILSISISILIIAFILYFLNSVSLLYPIFFTILGIGMLGGSTLYYTGFEKGYQDCSYHVESIMIDIGYQEDEILNLLDCLKEKYNNEIQN